MQLHQSTTRRFALSAWLCLSACSLWADDAAPAASSLRMEALCTLHRSNTQSYLLPFSWIKSCKFNAAQTQPCAARSCQGVLKLDHQARRLVPSNRSAGSGGTHSFNQIQEETHVY